MKLREFLQEQFAVIKEKDPAIRSPLEVWLYPSFRVQLSHRRAHRLYQKGHYFRARWISQRAKHKTGIEVHPRGNHREASVHRPRRRRRHRGDGGDRGPM